MENLTQRQKKLFYFLKAKLDSNAYFNNDEVVQSTYFRKGTFPTYQSKYLHSYVEVTKSSHKSYYKVKEGFKRVTELEFSDLLKQKKD